MGKSVTLQWKINKERSNDELIVAELNYFKGGIMVLFGFSGGNTTNVNAEREFGTRISAQLLDETRYVVTLKDLQYSDVYIFEFAAAVSRNRLNSDTVAANITIEKIEGTLDLLFSSPPKTQFKASNLFSESVRVMCCSKNFRNWN